eukprot:TRINITY_DN43118_c0_g1_i1.p1 TRINITY_DN43118_c0_g1~~TRINITY_DN43118_c0_g1_i1.p1  ORF type:complete len:623 (-),score=70.56 TRINITY_DN43118_c0_g1_i1:104-1705(-)
MQYSGHMGTYFWKGWSLVNSTPAKFVDVRSAADASVALRFATEHSLAISVKSTGHEWYGRSSHPGSLLLWTHNMADIVWTDSFVPAGCSRSVENAVTVGGGVMFWQLYTEAERKKRMVMGGTGGSVGAVGCTLGGCYGDYSRMYGSAATNLVEAEVVLADGSIIIASPCNANAEIFRALRGGGGSFGLVTKMTYRTYPMPQPGQVGSITGTVMQVWPASLADSVDRFLAWYADIINRGLGKHFGGSARLGGVKNYFTGKVIGVVRLQLTFVQLDVLECNRLVQPLGNLMGIDSPTCQVQNAAKLWPPSSARKSMRGEQGWYSSYEHPLGYVVQSKSRYFKLNRLQGELRESFALGLAELAIRAPHSAGIELALNYALGYGGHDSPAGSAEALNTSVHPDVFEAVGVVKMLAGYWNSLWWLPVPLDALIPTDGGARPPDALAQSAESAAAGIEALLPDSAAYFNEDVSTSFEDKYWGKANYDRLQSVKARVDPQGVFDCFHCVSTPRRSNTDSHLHVARPSELEGQTLGPMMVV